LCAYKELRAPLRWHTLLTTGEPFGLVQLAIPMTSLENTVVFTVPDNERWVLLGILMKNQSGQTCQLTAYKYDEVNSIIGVYGSISAANYSYMQYPNEGVDMAKLGMLGSPDVLYEGQKVYLAWGAAASKTGTSYFYLNILKFMVHDQI